MCCVRTFVGHSAPNCLCRAYLSGDVCLSALPSLLSVLQLPFRCCVFVLFLKQHLRGPQSRKPAGDLEVLKKDQKEKVCVCVGE